MRRHGSYFTGVLRNYACFLRQLTPLSHSGYDFGYLLKLLTNAPLPPSEGGFFDLLATWFPNLYDLKHMMIQSPSLRGGLQDLADNMGVSSFERGPSRLHAYCSPADLTSW